MDDLREALKSICQLWRSQAEVCRKDKTLRFDASAKVLWHFYKRQPYDVNLDPGDRELSQMPHDLGQLVRPQLPKAREFVNLMLPFVHEKVPRRTLSPRRPPLPPELQALAPDSGPTPWDHLRCWEMQYWLNYLIGEAYDLHYESRMAIPEGLVKGRAVIWHELVEGPHGLIPRSIYDTVDGLLIDADCRQYRDAAFILREREQSIWHTARRFPTKPEQLRASRRSHQHQAAYGDEPERGNEGDICRYKEIWSRMGAGHQLRDAAKGKGLSNVVAALESLGPHVYLAIADGVDHPLNIPEEILETATVAELKQRLGWPIAFFEEPSNPWPCSFMDIYPDSDSPWATSPLSPATPLQVFLDRAYTYAMDRIKQGCRSLTFVSEEVEESVGHALAAGNHGTLVHVKGKAVKLEELLYVFEFPVINKEFWAIVSAVERKYDDMTGSSPLLYGNDGDRQIRSAHEYQGRQQTVQSRPNDYRDAVRRWQKSIASKEGQATRLHVGPDVVAPLFGEPVPDANVLRGGPELNPQGFMRALAESPLSVYWSALVNTDDPAEAAAEITYEIESGPGERHDHEKRRADAQTISQTLLPVFSQLAGQGVVDPFNRLMAVLAEHMEIPALAQLQLQAPAPPPLPPDVSQPEPDEEPSHANL